MITHYIILAQGQQSRLPQLPVAKHLLPLPACSDVPIIYRTILQVMAFEFQRPRDEVVMAPSLMTVVGPESLQATFVRYPVEVAVPGRSLYRFSPRVHTLPDPGNSSLKGIDRYLRAHDIEHAKRIETDYAWSQKQHYDRVVVLLGDVIYSWACLRAILDVGPPWCKRFVGTADLSRSGGELWGAAWTWEGDPDMRGHLVTAIVERHPPFEAYQPGQMRRWLWQLNADARRSGVRGVDEYSVTAPWYTAIDDYTRDVDLPEHVDLVPAWSRAAAADDAKEGIVW